MTDRRVSKPSLYLTLLGLYTATGAASILQIPLLQIVLPLIALGLLGILILIALGLQGSPIQIALIGVGVSVVGLMIGGLIFDTTLSLFIAEPLTTLNLAITISLSGYVATYFAQKNMREHIHITSPSSTDWKILFCSICFLLITSSGVLILNQAQNYYILLAGVFGFAILFIMIILGLDSDTTAFGYQTAILLFGMSIFLPIPLRSQYIFGGDVLRIFWMFKYIASSNDWSIVAHEISMMPLSTTLIPSAITRLTGLDPIIIFKFLLPGLIVLVPIIIFEIMRQVTSLSRAFISGIFIIVSPLFPSATINPRTMVAIFCLASVVLSFVIWQKRDRSTRVIFLLLGIGIIVSHYTTGIIFLIMLMIFIIIQIIDNISRPKKSAIKYTGLTVIHLSILSIFSYVWFSITNPEFLISPISIFLRGFSTATSRKNPSRGEGVVSLFSLKPWEMAPVDIVYWVISWLVLGLVALGGLTLVVNWIRSRFLTNEGIFKFDLELGLGAIGAGILVCFVFVPFISRAYGLGRTYLTASLFLAPIFIIGASKVGEEINLNEHTWQSLAVILLFLFLIVNSLTLHNITNEPSHGLFSSSEGESLNWITYSQAEILTADHLDVYGDGRLFYSGRIDGRATTVFKPPDKYQPRLSLTKNLDPEVYPPTKEYILLNRENIDYKKIAINEASYNRFNYSVYQIRYSKIYSSGNGEVVVNTT